MKSFLANNIFKILIYLSLAFFVFYLYRFDYLALRDIKLDPWLFTVSIIFLFAGFVLSAISWWFIVRIHKIKVSVSKAIVSHGINVFAKYIPGKIWVILGRAGLVSKYTGKPVNELSIMSLKEQFVYVIMGLMLGLIPLIIQFGFGIYSLITILVIAGLSLLFLSKPVHSFSIAIINRFRKTPIEIPFINLQTVGKVSGVVLIYWLTWSAGFYFLLLSAFGELPLISAFAFPLGVSFGVLAIFLPGGIGVRESVITGFLVSVGIPLESAISISVLQRLWFICGEIFIFLLSAVLRALAQHR